jgi:hypothetical protein
MNTTTFAALIAFSLVAFFMTFKAIYLVRSEFMPYHQEAVGIHWQQLDQRLQYPFIGLMRVAGGGGLG